METYEIEIKSLLGTDENAEAFRSVILEKGAQKIDQSKQLNHYFIKGDFEKLLEKISSFADQDFLSRLKNILEKGSSHSVRTREMNGVVKLVVKVSIDATSSENGIARMEFEEDIDLSLNELDALLIDADFEYQAKWSRHREEYDLQGITICLDKNAGYGWLTEFELVISDESEKETAEQKIRDLMVECAVTELEQERLARMFDYYNENWRDYYGTDNIFTIE